jgi:xylose isomerase
MDCCARGLLAAAAMIDDGTLDGYVDKRYGSWSGEVAKNMLSGNLSLADIEKRVRSENINPTPVSGRQEWLENTVNRFV